MVRHTGSPSSSADTTSPSDPSVDDVCRGHPPGTGIREVRRVSDQGDGSRVTLDVDYDPPLGILGDIADKLVFERRHEREAEQLLSRLRNLCENSSD